MFKKVIAVGLSALILTNSLVIVNASSIQLSDSQYRNVEDTENASDHSSESEYDSETIKSVQQALNDAGYDCGSTDGIAGDMTQIAIQQYQADNGLTISGNIDDDLLIALNGTGSYIDDDNSASEDSNGSVIEIATLTCNDISQFSEGYASFETNSGSGYINSSGDIAIPDIYEYTDSFKCGLAKVKYNDNYIFIDKNGDTIIDGREWDSMAASFGNDLLAVKLDGKWGYVNTTGELVIEPQFDDAKSFSDGPFAAVQIGDLWGYINTTGELVIEPQWESAESFYGDFGIVGNNGKYGYIDSNGDIAIELQYDLALFFHEDGLAVAEIDDQFGYIDTEGNWVIQPQYDYAVKFSCGLALVKDDEGWKYINTNGDTVFGPDDGLKNSGFFSEGFTVTDKGLIDTEGNVIIDRISSDAKMTAVSEGLLVAASSEGLTIYDVSNTAVDNSGTFEGGATESNSSNIRSSDESDSVADMQIHSEMIYTDVSIVKKVQEALNDAGYECGTADGIAGSNTQTAVQQYQEEEGLTISGTINYELLESLNLTGIVPTNGLLPQNYEKEFLGEEYDEVKVDLLETQTLLASEIALRLYCIGKPKETIEQFINLDNAEVASDETGTFYTFTDMDLSVYYLEVKGGGSETWHFDSDDNLDRICVAFEHESALNCAESLRCLEEAIGSYEVIRDQTVGAVYYCWHSLQSAEIIEYYNFVGSDSNKDDGVMELTIEYVMKE